MKVFILSIIKNVIRVAVVILIIGFANIILNIYVEYRLINDPRFISYQEQVNGQMKELKDGVGKMDMVLWQALLQERQVLLQEIVKQGEIPEINMNKSFIKSSKEDPNCVKEEVKNILIKDN